MVNLGDVFPDFEAETNKGPIKFHQFLGDRLVSNDSSHFLAQSQSTWFSMR